MTDVLVCHHATFYCMVKSKMASVGHIDKLSIDHAVHGPTIGWVYLMGALMQVCFLKQPGKASKLSVLHSGNWANNPDTTLKP